MTFTGAETAIDINSYHFAMDGKTFAVIAEYYPELMPKVCIRSKQYAYQNKVTSQTTLSRVQFETAHLWNSSKPSN